MIWLILITLGEINVINSLSEAAESACPTSVNLVAIRLYIKEL